MMAAMDLAAALTALLILKPMLKRHHAQNGLVLGYEASAVGQKSVRAES
jgi:hypothetical protein